VTEEATTGPALLELAPLDERTRRHPIAESMDLSGPIPISQVVAIHLPSAESLREHTARPYANTHPHQDLLRVTPELFTEDDDHVLLVTLRSGATAMPSTEALDWQRFDRLRGAISAAVLAARSEKTLRTAAAFLPGGAIDGRFTLALLRGQNRDEEQEPAESTLFRAACDELAVTDITQAWDPVHILQQVKGRCTRETLPRDVTEELENNLERVRAIITNEREFAPFRTGRGLTSARALLLVLLRQELTELMHWPVAETGADPETWQVAAILAGTLRGLSREDISNRNVSVDDLTAGWLCSLAEHAEFAFPNVRLLQNGIHIELHIGNDIVARAPNILADPARFFAALNSPERHRLAPALADAIGAHETRRIFITASSATITPQPQGGLLLELPGDVKPEVRYDEKALRGRIEAANEEEKRIVADILQSAEIHTDDRHHRATTGHVGNREA
jgi:hypothetical protein